MKEQKFSPKDNPSTNHQDDEVLSLHAVAKLTGYHQDYLGQMARSGKLEARKIGRNWQTTRRAVNIMLGRETEDTKSDIKVEPVSEAPTVIASARFSQKEISKSKTFGKKIDVSVLNISTDAGPNLQEAIAVSNFIEKASGKFVGAENANVLHRWTKLMGATTPEGKNRTEVAQIKHELHNLSRELIATKNKLSQSQPRQRQMYKSNPVFIYATSALASVVIAAAGMMYFANEYFSDLTDMMISSQAPLQKMVAGESTSGTDPAGMLWPPPYITQAVQPSPSPVPTPALAGPRSQQVEQIRDGIEKNDNDFE